MSTTLLFWANFRILQCSIGCYIATTTIICLDLKVKETLKSLKRHPEESYNSVLERLVNMAFDREPLKEEIIERIEKGLKDMKKGRYYTEEEVATELGIREE